MKPIKLDRADDRVKEFFRALPIEPDGVELELNGKIVCKVVGPHQMTAADREAIVKRGRELMRQARERNRGVPAKVIEREVREAVEEVRGRKT
jgi:hypothetical protein